MLSSPELAVVAASATVAAAQAHNQATGAATSSSSAPSRGEGADADRFPIAVYIRWTAKPNVHRPCTSSKLGSIIRIVFGADHVAHVVDWYLRQGTDGQNGGYSVVGISAAAETILQSQSSHEDAHFTFTFCKADGQLWRPWGAAPGAKRARTDSTPPPPPSTALTVGHTVQQYAALAPTPYPYSYPVSLSLPRALFRLQPLPGGPGSSRC